ncbi:hypothetical protein GQ55_1G342800 [Panicum hallii var. hallii]|uniref:Uncharacterized protein n=1 Tax=Panicum hallii var. hallii TaxID=1504633 RepID=A0A2T7FAJ7_9POAL|nr:hypothetical protein GQ55_1G342800 [Panicum hallii var. hallii]
MERRQDHRAIRICHPSASPPPSPQASCSELSEASESNKRIEIFSSGNGGGENHIHSWGGLRHELICWRRQTIVYDRLG